MISSAGVALGLNSKYNDAYYHFKHQVIFGLFPGLFLFFFLYYFDYRKLKNKAIPLLVASIFLLILVFIPGIGADWGSARSWIKIFGFSLQPSEIVKLTFLIYLAAWLSSRGRENVKDLKAGLVPFLTVLAAVAGLLILEPDTGTMIVIVLMAMAVYFVAGAKTIHLFFINLVGVVSVGLLLIFSDYRANRFKTFLHPELDPLGVGYHINQALLAIGSGGWLGRGFGHSRQKFAYLPEPVGDSIFAIIGEELGFIFCVLLVMVFFFMIIRGLKLAQKTNDKFASLIVVGIMVWFGVQAFFNIGSMLGIMPMTGITLPFISYGGTSLMINLAAVGILGNISKQHS